MDVVELSEGGGEGGRRRPRAMVLKTQGVPGLNKISVRYAACLLAEAKGVLDHTSGLAWSDEVSRSQQCQRGLAPATFRD